MPRKKRRASKDKKLVSNGDKLEDIHMEPPSVIKEVRFSLWEFAHDFCYSLNYIPFWLASLIAFAIATSPKMSTIDFYGAIHIK